MKSDQGGIESDFKRVLFRELSLELKSDQGGIEREVCEKLDEEREFG